MLGIYYEIICDISWFQGLSMLQLEEELVYVSNVGWLWRILYA